MPWPAEYLNGQVLDADGLNAVIRALSTHQGDVNAGGFDINNVGVLRCQSIEFQGVSPLTSKWMEASGYIYPETVANRVLVGTSADDGASHLQVGGTRPTIAIKTAGDTGVARIFAAVPQKGRIDITANASYNGTAWNRDDTSAGALLFYLNPTTASGYMACVGAGENPISWVQPIAYSPTTVNMFGATFLSGGNVGIGTASPQNLLDVRGGRTILSPSNEPYALGVTYGYGTNGFYLGGTSDSALVFSTWIGLEKMRLTADGKLGINVTSPVRSLHVGSVPVGGGAALTGTAPSLALSNADTEPNTNTITAVFALATGAGHYGMSSGDVGILAMGSSRGNIVLSANYSGAGAARHVVLQPSSGNVGIGTTGPTGNLEVWGNNPVVRITQNPGQAGNVALNLVGAGASNTVTINLGGAVIQSRTDDPSLYLQPSGGGTYIAGNTGIGLGAAANIRCFVYTPTISHAAMQVWHGGNGSNPGTVALFSNGYAEASGGYQVLAAYGNNFATRAMVVLDDLTLRWRLRTSQPTDGLLNNQDIVMYLASNTSLRFRVRGADGAVREGTITLT
jgi:hypothetical protein